MTDVRGIYRDTFNLYLLYEKNKSMKEFNDEMVKISKKYNCNLCVNILISLAGYIQGEHDKLAR
jgi:hypothetical protein